MNNYSFNFEPIEDVNEAPQQDLNLPFAFEPLTQEKPKPEEVQPQSIYDQGLAGFTRGPRSALSSFTLGLSEKIPGLELTPQDYANMTAKEKLVSFGASFPAIEFAMAKIGVPIATKTAQWAAASPVGQSALAFLGKQLGVAATGASISGTEETIRSGELPSLESLAAHGATWSAIDTALSSLGKGGSYLSSLMKKKGSLDKATLIKLAEAAETEGVNLQDAKKVDEFVTDFFSKLEEPSSLDLSSRKITPKEADEYFADVVPRAKPLPESLDSESLIFKTEASYIPGSSDELLSLKSQVKPIEQPIVTFEQGNKQTNQALNAFEQRAPSNQSFGKTIQDDIQAGINKAKAIFTPLYEVVQTGAEDISHSPKKTIDASYSLLDDLKSMETKPSGYQVVENAVENVLTDLGHKKIPTSPGFPPYIHKEPVQVSKMIELKRRLNEIINYDVLDWEIKQRLEPIVKALREEINIALENASPDLKMAWRNAEEEYAKYAKTYKTKNMRQIRGQDKAERIASEVVSGTSLADLKKAVSPTAFKKVEREVLQKIADATPAKAESIYREVSSHLSPEANKLALDLLERNAARLKVGSPARVKSFILDDLMKSFDKGAVPTKTLRLWQSKKGRKIVADSLLDHPQKNEIMGYLDDLSKRQKQVSKGSQVRDKIIDDLATSVETGKPPKYTLDLWKTPQGKAQVEVVLEKSDSGKELARYLDNATNLGKSSADLISGKIQKQVLDDLSQSFTKGQRPDDTLKLFQSKKGRQHIAEALKGNPNNEEIITYLKDQSIADLSSSIIENGKISYKKLNKLLQNPEKVSLIKEVAGEEGVSFLKTLEQRSQQFEKNVRKASDYVESRVGKPLSEAPQGKIKLKKVKESNQPLSAAFEKTLEDFGVTSTYKLKHILGTLISGATLGMYGGGSLIAGGVGLKYLHNLLSSPKSMQAFKIASKKNVSTKELNNAIRVLTEQVED